MNKPKHLAPSYEQLAKKLAEKDKEIGMLQEAVRGYAEQLTEALIAAPGYEQLVSILKAAHEQAAGGKGAERHGNGLPFGVQPMQTISFLLHSSQGMFYQAIKKVQEANSQLDRAKLTGDLTAVTLAKAFAEREVLGAINYLAGALIFERSH